MTTSREFDDSTRYLQSLAGPTRGPLPATGSQRQTVSGGLRIVSASYGAGDRFVDVRQRLQSRIKDDQLDLQVTNSSMGSDPNRNHAETLRLRYEWAGRQYDTVVAENQWVTLPTEQQVREGTIGTGSTIEWPSERFKNVENALLRISYPDNWQAHGQGDAMTITPRGGLVNDGQGNQAMAYGVIVNIFEPGGDTYGQQLQGRGYGQAPAQNAAARLEQATDRLVQELRLSNRNMRVIRNRESIQVDGDRALSTYLSNDSPAGGRETDWLVTVAVPDGLLFMVFTAPERETQIYESTFNQMLRSVRIKREDAVLLLAGVPSAVAGAQGQSEGRGSGGAAAPSSTSVTVVFREADRVTFHDYFATHRIAAQALPPGIAKNVARGKPLPPGIAKRALPADLLAVGPKVSQDVSFAIVGEVVVAMKGGVVIDVLAGVFK